MELTLLENPRRKRRKSNKPPTRKQLAARRKFAAMVKARARKRTNPKLHKSYKSKVKHRPVFYGSSSKLGTRSPFKKLNPKDSIMAKHRKHSRRRRYRSNPGFSLKGLTGGLVNQVKDTALGAAAIVGGKILRNQINTLLKVPATNTTMSNVVIALALPKVAGMVFGANGTKLGTYAAASILADEAKAIPGVGPLLGAYDPQPFYYNNARAVNLAAAGDMEENSLPSPAFIQ